MSPWRLVIRETFHRYVNTALCLAAVAAGSGLLAGALTRFAVQDRRLARVLAQKEQQTRENAAALAADIRKAMRRLGYNAVLIPRGQRLGDWYAKDYASLTLPAASADTLERASGTVERYLPRLRRKMKLEGKKVTVIVVGVGRERIVDPAATGEEPLVEPVARGTCMVGHELHESLGLKTGDVLSLGKKRVTVAGWKEERGTKDDITIWMDLRDAQEIFDLPGRINEILVVEHAAIWGKTEEARRRFARILPEWRLVEFSSPTAARAHARIKTAEQAENALRLEREKRLLLRAEFRRAVVLFGTGGTAACVVWIAAFLFLNIRERRREIALLGALGFPGGAIRKLILLKALFIGTAGGIAGAAAGVLASGGLSLPPGALAAPFFPAAGAAAGAALLGAWLPARAVARLDPAEVLAEN